MTKEQASAVADQLIANAESKRIEKALARLALRAGKAPGKSRRLRDAARRCQGLVSRASHLPYE